MFYVYNIFSLTFQIPSKLPVLDLSPYDVRPPFDQKIKNLINQTNETVERVRIPTSCQHISIRFT